MAGKIVADTLEHSTAGSLDTQYVVNGSAKAWAEIAAGGASLPDSFNFSSIDDDGTGEYGLNFTSAMSNANYSANITITVNHSSGGSSLRYVCIEGKTTSSVEIDSAYATGSTVLFNSYDLETNANALVHGDLA